MLRFFTLLSVLILCTIYTSASVIKVPTDQSSIQAGINAAVNGDTVLVEDSTYYENINFMGKAITIASQFLIDSDSTHIDSTIIEGSLPSHADSGSVVFFVSGEDTNSVLYGFTITNGTGTLITYGSTERMGGGILCYNSGASIVSNKIINNSVTYDKGNGGGIGILSTSNLKVNVLDNEIKNNIVNGHFGAYGGGLLIVNASGKISGNVINNNSSISSNGQANGGGVGLANYLVHAPYVKVIDNDIRYNSNIGVNTFGAGIYVKNSESLVDRNNITNNELEATIDAYGGGVCLVEVTNVTEVSSNYIAHNTELQETSSGGGIAVLTCQGLKINRNMIEKNTVRIGGGIYTSQSNPTFIENNIIRSNSASFKGGGIFSFIADYPKIINNTITENSAGEGGGGLAVNDSAFVMNSIIWANHSPNDSSIHLIQGSATTIDVVYSDVQDTLWPGKGNISCDPCFCDSIYNLAVSSCCIGTGSDSIYPPLDYDGNDRPMPVGTKPDIGAQEEQTIINSVNNQNNSIPKVFTLKQNYPNPFNPSTTIEFSIPKSEFITLKIYNLLGQKVSTLVSEKLTQGEYKYTWDASHLASGMYYYNLETESYSNTKKLILLR